MKTDEIRERFLGFFSSKGHQVIKSDSLAPAGDPSVLFTGAGMNQFKDYFLGVRKDLKRACSSQKCLRTGDLDRVGQTSYHHSFFEMLGNFSFGDYFKREAIEWAWEFLTRELKLPKERLRVSVHEDDRESYNIWKDLMGVPESLLARLGDDSNFWPANARAEGPNGPCGPCSEIYVDQGENYPGAGCNIPWYEDNSGRFAEIWNLVFTQFDRQSDGSLKPLAARNIDTGAGLERIACILQGKTNNFEIDIFVPILDAIRRELHASGNDHRADLSAIADHVRAVAFAIADGIFPSNEGRGYVIRKLIRRSIWHAHAFRATQPFLFRTASTVAAVMGRAYPELIQAEKNITETIKSEEERFFETLDRGLAALEKLVARSKKNAENSLRGEDVFLLYDTYGFPDELTKRIAAQNGLGIDQTAYDQLMEEQRKRAKEKSKIAETIFSIDASKQEISHLPPTKFVGYETLEAEGKILWTKEGGDGACIVLDQTPFYAESGGQVGDQGILATSNFEFRVDNTIKLDKLTLHVGRLLKGTLTNNLTVRATVDQKRRDAAKRNHTATHLLQAMLRKHLGTHVRQVGSLVSPEKLRFDFLHGKALTCEELNVIEQEVNTVILENKYVSIREETYKKAAQEGALAFFGDKYDEIVRIVHVSEFSKELCGGTHCSRTGDIGFFIITSEGAIASGTRRIEALTGLGALEHVHTMRHHLKETAELLKTSPENLKERIERIQSALQTAEKEIKSNTLKAAFDPEAIVRNTKLIGSVHFVGESLSNLNIEELRKACDDIKKKNPKPSVTVLFGISPGKAALVVSVSKDLEETPINAGTLAKELSRICEGSGGGKKDFAQGGGKNPGAIPQALKTAFGLIQKQQGIG